MATKKAAAGAPPAAAKPGIAIDFDSIRNVIGLAEDDPALGKLLGKAGKVVWTKPDGGARYAQAKQAGFDLLVQRPRDAKRTAPKVVHTIFLYSGGVPQKHAQFAKPPFGITFTTRKEVLGAMPKPTHSWIIGKGKVPLSSKGVDHDSWKIDDLKVSVDYRDDEVRMILVSKD